jgi:hypothetical protein
MQCRSCGTEIADKAIVCYRCGAATTDPIRKPVPIAPRGRGWPSLAAGVTPLLAALSLLLTADTSGHPQAMTTSAEALAALGALVLIARLIRRR